MIPNNARLQLTRAVGPAVDGKEICSRYLDEDGVVSAPAAEGANPGFRFSIKKTGIFANKNPQR